jgi:dienelactone hydrolase
MPAWIAGFTWGAHLGPDVAALLTYAATRVPVGTPVVAAGFCHGGYVAVRAGGLAASPSSPLAPLVAVAGGHPSVANLTARLGEVEAEVLAGAQCPVMLLTAGNDSESSKPGGLAQEVLGPRAHLVEEADKVHGWIVRGEDEAAALASFDAIAAFLAKHVAAAAAAAAPGSAVAPAPGSG